MRITFEFTGGHLHGTSCQSESEDFVGAVSQPDKAFGFWFRSDHGRVGARFYDASDGADSPSEQVGARFPWQLYEVFDRSKEQGGVLVRCKHLGQPVAPSE